MAQANDQVDTVCIISNINCCETNFVQLDSSAGGSTINIDPSQVCSYFVCKYHEIIQLAHINS